MKKILLSLICSSFVYCGIQAQSYIPQRNDARFKVKPVANIKAYGFDLSDVKLLPGSEFYKARQLDSTYLLLLDPNRLLARFYINAGLPTKGDAYGGWESDGLSGHSLGHYLSAISMLYASTKDPQLKTRIDYITGELAKCQTKRGTGYVGAIPKEDSIFGLVRKGIVHSGGFDLNGGWSPWYTVHKVMAGLVDAYIYGGNKEALTVVKGMADWSDGLITHLDDSLMQKMMRCEFGGMNDVLAMIYAITGEQKYLKQSYRWIDDFVMIPLSERKDAIQNKHSNTNIPKGLGSADQYIYGGLSRDSIIAQYMQRTIVNHHTYANGGNGNYEYFGDEDKLSTRLSDDNSETCATYNMEKLTAAIFSWNPNVNYADYYERALVNGILGSQNDSDGMFCYFVPLRMGGQKEYSDQFNTFTCCVGTGMENHTKYNQAIYFQSPDAKSLYVNLFLPSELKWKEKNATIQIQSNILHSDKIEIAVSPKKATEFTIKLRKPSWVENDAVTIYVNGKKYNSSIGTDGYFDIHRKWKLGDKITYSIPKKLYAESMNDNSKRLAFYYGPVLLAGQLGAKNPDPVEGVPVILSENNNVNNWVKSTDIHNLLFKTTDAAQPIQVSIKPFYASDQGHYNVYWDKFTNEEWSVRKAEYIKEKEHEKEIELRTIDLFRIGEMQPERDHNFTSTGNSYVSEAFGKHGREARASGSLNFTMKVDPNSTNSLLINYIGADKNRKFDIVVDGKLLLTETTKGDFQEDKFYDKEYLIPVELTKGKSQVKISLLANHGYTAGRAFEIRTIKSK
ncbi:beta-L-arabinofuranosidase domain-containing protein [Rhizosphaericola mali]|uniref:Glycoside hydrolase family 127 protein n=1 Tax=Rhizosphaericola mali TaxID=2545455 RepID=A0A5P2G1T6_9BACT|nr:beta-L-arabinofuranosidase domain-containing protein [Rhizosphaericola mali]QES89137.1 glycoside hydrolase family 127 protein [Rhizosphaericola mali]